MGDAADVLGAVIIGDEEDVLAVAGKQNVADVAVEGAGKDFGFTAVRRRDGEVLRGVLK